MIAFDTSLLIRIATADDARQKSLVLELLESDIALVPKTVLLETAWVLRSRYARTPDEIHAFLTYLVESERVVIEDDASVRNALRFYAEGANFADAIHLASAGEAQMHTFDQAFCRKAIKKGSAPAVKVLRA